MDFGSNKVKGQSLMFAMLLPALMGGSFMGIPQQKRLKKIKNPPIPEPIKRSETYKALKKKAKAKTKKRKKKRGY